MKFGAVVLFAAAACAAPVEERNFFPSGYPTGFSIPTTGFPTFPTGLPTGYPLDKRAEEFFAFPTGFPSGYLPSGFPTSLPTALPTPYAYGLPLEKREKRHYAVPRGFTPTAASTVHPPPTSYPTAYA